MITNFIKARLEKLLEDTEIEIGRDIIFKDDKAYRDILLKGRLGFGESFRDNLWESSDLLGLFKKIIRAGLHKKVGRLWTIPQYLQSRISNMQNKIRSKKV